MYGTREGSAVLKDNLLPLELLVPHVRLRCKVVTPPSRSTPLHAVIIANTIYTNNSATRTASSSSSIKVFVNTNGFCVAALLHLDE
jgi:hypothetical protein